MIISLHHVQLAMPAGGEDQARAFYGTLLGLTERRKPENMQQNGGCWFEQDSVRVHLGIEEGFRPALKAHPAFMVSGFRQLREKLLDADCNLREANKIDDSARFFVDDPFGNRIEFIDVEKSV